MEDNAQIVIKWSIDGSYTDTLTAANGTTPTQSYLSWTSDITIDGTTNQQGVITITQVSGDIFIGASSFTPNN